MTTDRRGGSSGTPDRPGRDGVPLRLSDRRANRLLGAAIAALAVSVLVIEGTVTGLFTPPLPAGLERPLQPGDPTPGATPLRGGPLPGPAAPGVRAPDAPAAGGGPAVELGADSDAEPLAVRPVPAGTPVPDAAPEAIGGLGDDDGGAAMFGTPLLVPGQQVVRCIQVTYRGTANTADVMLSAVADGPLTADLELRVERGRDGRFDDCSTFTPEVVLHDGTLAGFTADHGRPATALPVATGTAPGVPHVFRFTVRLSDPAQQAGAVGSAHFEWHLSPTG